MRTFLAFLVLSSMAFGSAFTASVTGNWASTSTWGGSGPPGSGDTVTINDGVTVTIPVSTSVTVGSSPTTDGGTPAIQTASSSGTGQLVINGTLIYRGPIRMSNHVTIGAGATITHDSHLSAASGCNTTPSSCPSYTWIDRFSGSADPQLIINGSSGSHVTWNIAAGSNVAGYIGSAADNSYTGTQITATYTDFSDIGATYSFDLGIHDSGKTFSLDHVTCARCAIVRMGELVDGSNFSITNSVFTAPVQPDRSIFLPPLAAKTSGTRSFTGNYFEGSIYLQSNASGTDIGLSFQNNFCYIVTTTLRCVETNDVTPPIFSGPNWNNNVLATYIPSSLGFPANSMPGGTLNRTYMLYGSYLTGGSSSINYHWMFTTPVSTALEQFIFEADNGGVGDSDAIQMVAASLPLTVSVKHTIYVPGADNFFGSLTNYDYSTPCNGSTVNCPTVTFQNNTAAAPNFGGACGVSGEGSGIGYAGLYTVEDNVIYRASAGTGCIGGPWTSIANMFTIADYNAKFNLTGDAYRFGTYPGNYAATPGTHDQSGDPQFVDGSRNFLKWCKSLDNTITTWDGCRAKFQSQTSGFTPTALIDYVRAGYQPQAAYIATMSSTGGYVGAVPPAASSPTMTISGATIKGAAIK